MLASSCENIRIIYIQINTSAKDQSVSYAHSVLIQCHSPTFQLRIRVYLFFSLIHFLIFRQELRSQNSLSSM